MKRHIPNFITLLNLLAGCMAILAISGNHLNQASWWIILAAVLDLLDGLIARLINATSPLGKQLDSLADIVSFGLAPGYMLYTLIGASVGTYYPGDANFEYMAYIAFLVPAFAALRLAKFNIDPAQEDDFRGLPTPANALFILAIPIFVNCELIVIPWLNSFFTNPWVLSGLAVVLSILMVSGIHLFSMKVKSIYWRHNRARYIFLPVAVILFFSMRFASVPFILLFYIVLSQFRLNDPLDE